MSQQKECELEIEVPSIADLRIGLRFALPIAQ